MAIIVASMFGFALMAALVVAEAFVLSLPVMWLWNAAVPAVIGFKPLTWTQALWLSTLCGLLLKTGEYRHERISGDSFRS